MVTREKKLMNDGTVQPATLPEIGLEGNRIARNAAFPSVQTTKQKVFSSAGALGATLGAVAATTPAAPKKNTSGGRVTPTNPYASQMATAEATLNKTAPAYVDSYGGRIQQLEAEGPGKYNSKYQQNIDQLLDKVQNREAFRFNMSEDPLYRQLVAQHMAAGKQAMQDTMGKAAALTSGYGNSYASTAAQQAYQQQVNQVNDKALDLYAMAKGNYDQEGAEMRSNLAALQNAEAVNRDNFESDRNDYYNRLAALKDSQDREYQRYMNEEALLDADQQRAWEQYVYWNDLWEKKR